MGVDAGFGMNFDKTNSHCTAGSYFNFRKLHESQNWSQNEN